MALLDFSLQNDIAPTVECETVRLRQPRFSDYEQWHRLREESREHLTRWEPDWAEEETTFAAYKERVKSYIRATKRGVGVPFFMFRQSDDTLIGGVNLINIIRGACQSASLGYWTGEQYTRCGYGQAGVQAIVDHGISTLGLNRIEAACQPDNLPSRALLEKLSFHQEGYAQEYLYINGAWRDHMIYAMTARYWAKY